MTLNEADKAMLRFLKQQVDRLQDELYSTSPRPSIRNELHLAIRELKEFTSDRRKKGYRI
jgi:hypothetical protein